MLATKRLFEGAKYLLIKMNIAYIVHRPTHCGYCYFRKEAYKCDVAHAK